MFILKMVDVMSVLVCEMNFEFLIWMRWNFDLSMFVVVGVSFFSLFVILDVLENVVKEVDW